MNTRFATAAAVVGLLTLLSTAAFADQTANRPSAEADWIAVGTQEMVASDSVYASQAGAEILRAGGNAVDAAVATSLALAVTRPGSTGLGGGTFFVVRMAQTGEVFVLDARECGPAASTADMFVKARAKNPSGPPPSQFGGLAAAVPGILAGHAAVLERLGTRKFSDVVQPALRLARDGFPVDDHYLSAARGALATIRRHPELQQTTALLRRTLLFDGHTPAVGATLKQPELAEALRLIGESGADAFYHGPIAQALVETVQRYGGIITLDDLAGYRPRWREPLRIRYRDRYELLLMPPASSGGICVAETLNILESWDLKALRRQQPAVAAHVLVEALKHAFADRARHLGDADFAPVPVQKLISKEYARSLAKHIDPCRNYPVDQYGSPLPEDHGTSHYCVVDRWGNIVSATETINLGFGSMVMVEGFGIVLNNEMDDFTPEPGKPNAFGLTQSDWNVPAPGKRPLSSMTPTIVLEDGKPVLAVGASGGPRIITATLQVILNVIESEMDLQEAIAQPRLHHQWQPDVVYRNGLPVDGPVIEGLRQRGHKISDENRGAVVQAIQIKPGKLIGASDPRKGGKPVGR